MPNRCSVQTGCGSLQELPGNDDVSSIFHVIPDVCFPPNAMTTHNKNHLEIGRAIACLCTVVGLQNGGA